MNLYRLDYSLLDMGFADPSFLFEYHENSAGSSISAIERNKIDRGNINDCPPKNRYDGTSPLPLGMDWRPSPLNWVQFIFFVPFWSFVPNEFGLHVSLSLRFFLNVN